MVMFLQKYPLFFLKCQMFSGQYQVFCKDKFHHHPKSMVIKEMM